MTWFHASSLILTVLVGRIPVLDTLDVHSKTSPYQTVRDIFFAHSLDLPPVQARREQQGSPSPDTVMSDLDNRASTTDSQFGTSTASPHPGEQRKYVCMLYGPWLIDSMDRPCCSFCGMCDASEEHLLHQHQAFECFAQPAGQRTYSKQGDLSTHMRCFHYVNEDSLVTMTEHDGPVRVDTMVTPWARGWRGTRREEEEGGGDEGS